MLEKEYKYFEKMSSKFVKEHSSEFVLIKDEKAAGFNKTIDEALKKASEKFELGTFLVQQCLEKEESIQKYHSMVLFF